MRASTWSTAASRKRRASATWATASTRACACWSRPRAPMRLVTALSLFGLCANLLYSVYVVAVGLLRSDVAPGWISLSLQQSGMFFLISLVLLVLGEYILNMASLSNEGPPYHVGQELTSVRVTRREKLNVEEAAPDMVPDTVR
ncbi:hypothetical protein LP420_27140 [Massilia sp. B-10]|nr:hypothetical protein LP420_27140 [Massilia sp. B-10]